MRNGKMEKFIDTHAHYDDSAFDLDRDEILKNLPNKNVCYVVNAGADIESSKSAVNLSEKYNYIYAELELFALIFFCSSFNLRLTIKLYNSSILSAVKS